MKIRLLPVGFLPVACALLMTGLVQGHAATARTVHAVASFTVLADVVRQVGGTHVAVTSLVPPDGDPHEFEPSPADAGKLQQADVIFLSGEGLETWFVRLSRAAGYHGTPVIVSNGVPLHEMVEDGHDVTDPHVWNSVPNVEIWTHNIRDALIRVDPQDAEAFRANADAYLVRLHDLDHYIRDRIATVPADRRRVLTGHDAFGYFGREYGVTLMAPQGLSTETEASAADVAALIRQIRTLGVSTYFMENAADPRLVQQVATATGARPGGTLYVEALSPPGGPAADYISMIHHDVDLMVQAMQAAH